MEEMQYRNFSEVYNFQENNPYTSLANPLEGIKQIIESGNTIELTQLLEAHLQKNPNDAKGWRVLGMLFQDRDQDQKGVTCLLQAIKANPADKDSLLQLGVSCLNIFDEIHAMNFIGKGVIHNI
jgi:peroxin-5